MKPMKPWEFITSQEPTTVRRRTGYHVIRWMRCRKHGSIFQVGWHRVGCNACRAELQRWHDRQPNGPIPKASHIDDKVILSLMMVSKKLNEGRPVHLKNICMTLAMFPRKVIQAKLASMIRRGIITGCACGCRGDFEFGPQVDRVGA